MSGLVAARCLQRASECTEQALPAETNGLVELQIELAQFRQTTRSDIDGLKAEVKRLTEELQEVRSGGNRGRQAESPVETKAKSGVSVDAAHCVQPITYDEAFKAIGGNEELTKYTELSSQLQGSVNNDELEAELKQLLPRDYTKRTGFSTKLINQPFVRDLEELYARANAVYAHFDEAVRTLAEKTNSKPLVPPIKGEVRARMKALFKYRDVSNDGVAWYRLTDLVRGTLEFVDIASLYEGLKEVIAFFGDAVKELNDRYQRPLEGGYRDIQLVVYFEEHMCELQLSTEPMTRAKQTTGHRDFEVVRELKAAVAEGDLGRVINALEFGREHLGSAAGEGQMALSKLLRSKEANTLPHDAASCGRAEILHAFLLHGADANAQNANGDTPLHLAVFGGHERCVWVLVNMGKPDLDIQNAVGQTPLVKGYLMLWQRPPEQAVRAVSTLAQVAGVERIKAARSTVDEEVRKLLKPNRSLVDYSADGNLSQLRASLCSFSDPNSVDAQGMPALFAAAMGGHLAAVKLLLEFGANPKLRRRSQGFGASGAVEAALLGRHADHCPQIILTLLVAGAQPPDVLLARMQRAALKLFAGAVSDAESASLLAKVVVKGAGFSEVNGEYTLSGEYKGGQVYTREHSSLGKLTIRRWGGGDTQRSWVIGLSGEYATNGDLYHRTNADPGQSTPPNDGWKIASFDNPKDIKVTGNAPTISDDSSAHVLNTDNVQALLLEVQKHNLADVFIKMSLMGSISVEGAGLNEVNGKYFWVGEYNGGQVFRRVDPALGMLTIRRWGGGDTQRSWVIGLSGEYATNGDLYHRMNANPGQSTPPSDGWEIASFDNPKDIKVTGNAPILHVVEGCFCDMT